MKTPEGARSAARCAPSPGGSPQASPGELAVPLNIYSEPCHRFCALVAQPDSKLLIQDLDSADLLIFSVMH